MNRSMAHLFNELKVPEPIEFHVKQTPGVKPQVKKKTEEDEFEAELPPSKSGERRI